LAERTKFLQQIEDILATTNLYYILTPERQYVNVNPIRHELVRRGAAGAYFLTEVDLYFREIRSVAAQYTITSVATANAKDVSASPSQNNGTVSGEEVEVEPALDNVVTR
jgi:hypothetical protein